MSEDSKGTKVRVAGLWRGKTKDGSEYLSGGWGNVRILIFPNGYKEGEKAPDFHMYLAPRQRPTKPLEGSDVPASDEHEGQPF